MNRVDIVLINPGDRKQVYQGLGANYSAIEPPFWIAAIAAYLRNEGLVVSVIDANADNLTPDETADAVNKLKPLLSVVIVYGSQPSASTQNMSIAGRICKAIKESGSSKVALAGLHPSALPERTLKEERVDFVIEGEGFITLNKLVKVLKSKQSAYANIPGLWYYQGNQINHTKRSDSGSNIDQLFSIAAWDLLPMNKYRAHNWHCFDEINVRAPYAAIYTSFGCPYNCIFCCINVPFGKPGIRYRSPEKVIEEIELLTSKYKVRNLKIADELFVLNEEHYMKIVDLIIARKFNLNIWAYARVDTVNFNNLAKMKKAGINWLALGIESANSKVRDGVSKNMRTKDVKKVVTTIQSAGINVMGNFIFGLPDDTLETMQETLDMAMELNCEFINFYCAMAYPGSQLYRLALKENWNLPDKWHAYSQHSYETLPLPTKHLGAKEVLKFRDDAFHKYFENPVYLEMIERRFGSKIKDHVKELTKIRLKRKLFL